MVNTVIDRYEIWKEQQLSKVISQRREQKSERMMQKETLLFCAVKMKNDMEQAIFAMKERGSILLPRVR